MRINKLMKKIILYSILLLALWVTLSQCLIMRNRWSDGKAYKVFAQKNVPLQLLDTTINNHLIHYAVCGDTNLPTLLIIHGSPGSWMNYMHYMWDTSMRKKFRIIAFDRPGFGYSDFGKAQNLQTQASLLLPVIEKLKTIQPIYLMGHSLGGPLVVLLASQKPTLFAKLIIVAGAIDVAQEKKENWRHVMNVKPFYWLLPGAFGPSNTELLYLKKDLITLQPAFTKITCDVLFVHGDKDTWVPIENIAYGKNMMTNASSIKADTIKNADHQIPWKNEERLKEILLGLN
jgi:pimeloyl-ACP methyl ester carboxylesterase